MPRLLLKCLPLLALATMAAAYDYTTPMPGTRALPLELPEQPFVLRFTDDELLAQPIWSNRIDAILIPNDAPSPIRVGATALRDTLAKLHLGDARLLEVDPKQQDLPAGLAGDHFIVLGVPKDSKLAQTLAQDAKLDVSDAALNGDGFYLKPMKRGTRQLLLITSPVPRGVMYGAYELEERTTARGVPNIDQKFAPTVRYRGWPFFAGVTTPAKISGRYRYNLSIDGSFWQHLLPYKDYPELGGEQHKDELLATQQTLHKSYADVAAYGSMPALFFNPLSLQWTPIGLEPARKALAAQNAAVYKDSMLPITKDDKNVRMKRDTDMFYVSAAVCLVREATYLFDKEFPSENTLSFFDQAIGLGDPK